MDKEKQIPEHYELAKILADNFTPEEYDDSDFEWCAYQAIQAGYRKQSEGHWILIEYEYFTCSKCGHYHYNGSECTAETKRMLAEGEYPNYCPNCGAKMDGERKEQK